MKPLYLLATLCCIALLIGTAHRTYAQYDLSPDTTKPEMQDAAQVAADSLKADSTREDTARLERADENANPVVTAAPTAGVVAQANTWLRRLLYRGALDATEIGAYAQYQLTPWDEKVGSYGPVEARLTVYYLGTSEWMGRDAEWLQAVYQTLEGEETMVEYDLIVPSSSEIKTVHRILYRVDRGEVKSMSFALPADQMDYDAADKPADEGAEQIKLYSGTYTIEKFRGSGTDGAGVVIYRSKTVPPLDVVRLGYGDEGLTLTGTGSDAAPRFDVPPPPSVSHTGDGTQPH